MQKLWPLAGGAYVILIAKLGANYFGPEWKLKLLVVLLAHLAVLALIVRWMDRRLRQDLDAADPGIVRDLERDDPEFAEYRASRTRVNERRHWGWTLSDYALGIAGLSYPAAIYTFIRYGALSGNTPFDGIALLLVFAGVTVYVLHRRRRLRTYQCPRCGTRPVRLEGDSIRLSCSTCGITWLLGDRVLGAG